MNKKILIFIFGFSLATISLRSQQISFVDLLKDSQTLSNWEHFFYQGGLDQISGKKILAEKFIKTKIPYGFPLNYVSLESDNNLEKQRLDSSRIEKQIYCQNHFPDEFHWLEIYLMIPYELDQFKTLERCIEFSKKTNDKELINHLQTDIRKDLLVYLWDPIFDIDIELLPQGIDPEILRIVKDFAYLDAIVLSMLPKRVLDFKNLDLKRLQKKQMGFYHSPIKSEWLNEHQYLLSSKIDMIKNPIIRLLESVSAEEWDELPEDRSDANIHRWRKMISIAKVSNLMPQESKNIYESIDKCFKSLSYHQKRYLRIDMLGGQLEEEYSLLEMEEKAKHLKDQGESKFWLAMIAKMQSSRWQLEKRKQVELICKASLQNKDTWESILIPEFNRRSQR